MSYGDVQLSYGDVRIRHYWRLTRGAQADVMADETRATPPTTTTHCPIRQRLRLGRALARRWPTALALALTAGLIVGDSAADGGDAVTGYAEVLPLLPLLYVV